MRKKIIAGILAGIMAISMGTVAFAADEFISVGDAVESAELDVDDLHEAGAYFKSASESGDIDGFETEYKYAKAAAALGNGNAMLWIGELFQGHKIAESEEVEDPVAVAVEWWEKAAEYGEPRGLANIGLLYQNKSVPGGGDDHGSIELDNEKAFEYFVKSSDGGDSKAPRYVGICYEDGVGVEADPQKAFEYFKLAAERKDSTGRLKYADYLLDGTAGTQDVEGAIAIYQELVDTKAHDLSAAALKLGNIYKDSIYVEADKEKAEEYYQIVLDNETEGSDYAIEAQAALDKLK